MGVKREGQVGPNLGFREEPVEREKTETHDGGERQSQRGPVDGDLEQNERDRRGYPKTARIRDVHDARDERTIGKVDLVGGVILQFVENPKEVNEENRRRRSANKVDRRRGGRGLAAEDPTQDEVVDAELQKKRHDVRVERKHLATERDDAASPTPRSIGSKVFGSTFDGLAGVALHIPRVGSVEKFHQRLGREPRGARKNGTALI